MSFFIVKSIFTPILTDNWYCSLRTNNNIEKLMRHWQFTGAEQEMLLKLRVYSLW
jgi:hypothetical protein